MESAIQDSQMLPFDVGWIRASGAGGKEQDASEVMAIKSLFGDIIPFVSSTEAHFGHCNGAGPAIGLVSAVETQRLGRIPPTINYEADTFDEIDFVPNQSVNMVVDRYLSTTAAFGGTNVVLVGGTPKNGACELDLDEVVVSGIGIVSPFGCHHSQFAEAIGDTKTFVGSISRDHISLAGYSQAALVQGFSFRREAPSIPSRGLDLLTQYAAVAAKRAIAESEAVGGKFTPNRLGVVTGISKTSGGLLEKLFDEIRGPWARPSVGRALLNKGRFLVTSRLAHWLNCKSYNATHSNGIGCGLMALNQTYEQLRQSDATDAVVVVAADEVSRIGLSVASHLGWLAKDGEGMHPYDSTSKGMHLGEGAVAIVLERRSSVERRGGKVLASISSVSSSLDQMPFSPSFQHGIGPNMQIASDGTALEYAMLMSLSGIHLTPEDVDLVLGSGLGIPTVDRRENSVVNRTISNSVPYGSTHGLTGVMYSSSSLFNVAMAIAAMHDPKARDLLNGSIVMDGRHAVGRVNHAMVLTTSEDGHNAVTVLQKE